MNHPSPIHPRREAQGVPSLTFWFDPISPYAWLAFDRLSQVLEGLSYRVAYRPVLFAGLLQHHAHKGPAEIDPKRAWIYRDVAWHAHRQGTPLDLPMVHPFNPCRCCVWRWPSHRGAACPTAAWSRR